MHRGSPHCCGIFIHFTVAKTMHRTGITVDFDRRPSGRFTGQIFLEQGFHLTYSERDE